MLLATQGGQVQLLAARRSRQHLCFKVINVEAKEGGAQEAALLEAKRGLEGGRETLCCAHCHGHTSVYRACTTASLAAQAVSCQLLQEQIPRGCRACCRMPT